MKAPQWSTLTGVHIVIKIVMTLYRPTAAKTWPENSWTYLLNMNITVQVSLLLTLNRYFQPENIQKTHDSQNWSIQGFQSNKSKFELKKKLFAGI